MKNYNPMKAPEPKEWLAEDEGMRILLVEDWHKKARIKIPGMRAHASIHAAVENQIAMGSESRAGAALKRLMSEGLDRHDAIHAIGSELNALMLNLWKHKFEGNPNDIYNKRLDALTAEKWLRGDDEDQ